MDAVLVIPLAEDEKESHARRLVASSRVRDVVFCVDEDYPWAWPHRYGHVVRCEGFGVGKALEEGFRYAFRELGAEYVVRSDNHVEFLMPAESMLDDRLREYVILPLHRTPEGATEHGVVLDWRTWDLRWNHRPGRLLPCAMNPVWAVHRSLAELLWSAQGYFFAVPYWGKENFDATLSLARLGHPVLAVPTCEVVHHYKRSWPGLRVARRCTEPWCREAPPGSAYFASVSISDAVFALRHYSNPWAMPFRSRVPDWAFSIALRHFPDRARYLPGEPVGSLYRRLGWS